MRVRWRYLDDEDCVGLSDKEQAQYDAILKETVTKRDGILSRQTLHNRRRCEVHITYAPPEIYGTDYASLELREWVDAEARVPLTPYQRYLLERYEYCGTYEATARDVGISRSTAYRRICEARAVIATQFWRYAHWWYVLDLETRHRHIPERLAR